MTTPLPGPDTVLLGPPTAAETQETARGVASAASYQGGLTGLQRALLEALFHSMTGNRVDLRGFEPVSAADFAMHLAHRDLQFRSRGVDGVVDRGWPPMLGSAAVVES